MLSEIARAAAVEAERQQVGVIGLGNLIKAYGMGIVLSQGSEGRRSLPSELDCLALARTVLDEPGLTYRKTNVTFRNGGSAAPWQNVPFAMERIFQAMHDRDAVVNAYDFVKSFLSIHPFYDGNGRVGWILYNWISGNDFAHPLPLPDYNWG